MTSEIIEISEKPHKVKTYDVNSIFKNMNDKKPDEKAKLDPETKLESFLIDKGNALDDKKSSSAVSDKTISDSIRGINNTTKRSISSLKAERDRYLSEREKLGMPNGNSAIKRKRFTLNKKAKSLNIKINALEKLSIEKKGDVEKDEITKFKNLANSISYMPGNLCMMSRELFEIEKMNILEKADKIYVQPAKIITDYILMMSHATDGIHKISGYSLDLKQSRSSVELNVRKCLIQNAMQGRDIANVTSNPYIGLGIALIMPLAARFLYNRSELKDAKLDKNSKTPIGIKINNNNKNKNKKKK